jgi:hypothetical protein
VQDQCVVQFRRDGEQPPVPSAFVALASVDHPAVVAVPDSRRAPGAPFRSNALSTRSRRLRG